MIVTVSARGPLTGMRWPLIVAAASFSVAVWWPAPAPSETTSTISTTAMSATAATLATPSSAALLALGGSANVWIEPWSPVTSGDELHGFRLVTVPAGSPWARAGLQDGDIVLAIDDVDVDSHDLSPVLAALTGGAPCQLRCLRPALSSDSFVVTLNLL